MSEKLASKEYYKTFLADSIVYPSNEKLTDVILSYKPQSVFEFGAGVGKNIRLLWEKEPTLNIWGIDVSPINIDNKVVHCIELGDEYDLQYYSNFDVVFTCSVLDHIEKIDTIIRDFTLMAKHIVLCETNTYDVNFYYKHNYESMGFTKLDYEFKSPIDGATYNIWVMTKKST